MKTEIQFTSELVPAQIPPPDGKAGAWVEFHGIVRGDENGQAIAALEYEAYAQMAGNEIQRILDGIATRHPCLYARVIHRIGIVPAGETAFYAGIAARHRTEAFALLAEFMNRLKQDVPIWKRRALPPAELARGKVTTARTVSSQAVTPDEVLALLRVLCRPLAVETAPLSNAGGRVLRETVLAPEDQPPFDRSSVDGYAVRLDDTSPRFRIVDEIRAGDWKPRQLQPGETVRIATGGAVPCADLRIVMKEQSSCDGGTVTLNPTESDRNIRFQGEDTRRGQVLVEPGSRLQPGTLALLASIGHVEPLVTRLPSVLHVATGNEIVPPDQKPNPGQIRDSNTTQVRAFLARWGVAPTHISVPEGESSANAPKSLPSLADCLRSPAATGADLILISGGASVGEHDFTLECLKESGFKVHVRQTTTRPGKPLIVAQRSSTLALGLPGNPLAHFVCLNLYLRAALEAFAGLPVASLFQSGVLAADLPADGHPRETFWPAHWAWRDDSASLTPLRWKSSGDLTALATANALIRVPPKSPPLLRGQTIVWCAVQSLSGSPIISYRRGA